jgi:hypothetical protein
MVVFTVNAPEFGFYWYPVFPGSDRELGQWTQWRLGSLRVSQAATGFKTDK